MQLALLYTSSRFYFHFLMLSRIRKLIEQSYIDASRDALQSPNLACETSGMSTKFRVSKMNQKPRGQIVVLHIVTLLGAIAPWLPYRRTWLSNQ